MRIFISYAHVDWQFVKSLAERLRRYHDVWYDDRLHAGQDWWETILRQIDWCECFIYVLTPESLTSKYCLDEYEEAKRLNRQIIPVRMQPNITLPDALGRIQYADFAERLFEDAMIDLIGDLGQLALTLRAQPPKAEPQTSPPTPAPLVESALGKPFDPAEIFRQAGEAQRVGEYETALRLLNTLRLDVPDYLPNYVSIQVVDIERALKEQAQHKEYLRVYEQIGLLAQGEKTLDAARQLWLELRRDYTGIGEDPENLAALLYPPIDDVLPPPFEWLEIPAGLVKLEGSGDSYIPHGKSEAFLGQGFVIAKYPITNSQFQFFVEAGDGYRNTHWWDYSDEAEVWRSFHTQPKEPEWGGPYDHPRVNLAWFDAVAFCRWLSSRSGVMVRLPTEQEWQRAAQGDDGRRYPWGNQEPNAELANFDNQVGKTTPVGSYPKGASPYGALDMAGNVWEWCSTDYQTGLHNIGQAAVYRVVRGGSWGVKPFSIRTARRSRGEPSSEGSSRGFRCACSF